MKKIIIVISAGIMIEAVTTGADSPKPAQSMNACAMIVSGINKNPNEQQAKDKAVTGLRTFLLDKVGIEPNKLSVLVGRPAPVYKDSKLSTADNIRRQIDTLAATIRPTDRFIFYYVGQANVVVEKLRFNLPGPDVTHEQLATWLKEIKASSMVIVLDCPGAGLAVKTLTGKNRIIIGACTVEQRYSTQFSKYFVPALTDLQTDTDGDGRVSVLEALTFTARQLDDSYRRRGLVQTETPILEDNADGVPSLQPWRYRENRLDGLAASMCFLMPE
ncbi:MAG: hypothetical protein P8Z79_04570 [Sedimentisphaerales bacterium]